MDIHVSKSMNSHILSTLVHQTHPNRHTRWYGLVHVRSVSDVRGWVDRRPSTTSSLLLLAALNVGSCGGAAGRPPAGQHSVCMVCVHCTPTTSRRPASSIAATRMHVRREMW
jgi:hypothetical protein